MTKYKLEYIWLDGYEPVPNLRGKTQIKEFDEFPEAGRASAVGLRRQLRPARPRATLRIACSNRSRSIPTARTNGAIVMCEVMLPDGSPHPRNARATILDDPGAWFGFEQEYFFYKDGRPLGFPRGRLSRRRRANTTPASATRTSATSPARSWTRISTSASTPASTTKASMPKWPRASGNSRSSAKAPRNAADQMWVARYLLHAPLRKIRRGRQLALQAARQGRGLERLGHAHATSPPNTCAKSAARNTSRRSWRRSTNTRTSTSPSTGPDNHLRLTGLHETQSIDKFNYGVANRGASVRVPHSFINNGYKGYLEDRRPNSAGRPLQDRLARSEDDRFRPHGKQRFGRRLMHLSRRGPHAATLARGRYPDPPP